MRLHTFYLHLTICTQTIEETLLKQSVISPFIYALLYKKYEKSKLQQQLYS